MKRRKNYKVLFSFVLCCLLGACQSSAVKNQQKSATPAKAAIKINLGADPQTLDPRKARDLHAVTLVKMLFEGLTRVGKNDLPELALARSVEISEDLKRFTFNLRYSEWSNGDPLTANDFVYAWKKVLDPQFLAENAQQLYVIKNAKAVKEGKLSAEELGAKAIDPMTLEVELENPTPYFLELMAFPVSFPVCQKVDEENAHWAESVSTYICNGPFKLKEWKHQDAITAEKNEYYWDVNHVHLNEIEMVMVQEDAELKMYRKKELNWVGSPLSTLSLEALPELKKNGEVKAKSILGTYFLRANTEKVPFDNVKIRRAFALAMQREEIVEHVTQGGQTVATGLVPLSLGLQKQHYFEDGATDQARALFDEGLKEEGLSLEKMPEITYSYIAGERNHLIAQTLQQQWSKVLGVKVHLESIERKVFIDKLSKQDYHLAAGSWLADYNDPINFLEVFKYKKASTNNTNWENEEYAELLDRSSTILDPDARLKILSQSEKILMEEMPIMPIFYYTMLYVHENSLKDVVLTSLGNLDFKWAYLENGQ
ncbi:MAG TPA: peptide ABC transporter substrate-binding protein [Rhabdochlamydiaceae bacterium]|nr:peptide ABC transporter substrate-binding protein [Rhabdochlamydiaceae bacterium]